MIHKIITTGRLSHEFHEAMKSYSDYAVRQIPQLTYEDIAWADGLAAFYTPTSLDLSSLKWIHAFGAGVEGFRKRKDLHENVILTRTVGELGYKMGEFCLAHILASTHHLYFIRENQLQRKWETKVGDTVQAKNVLILGTGQMAQGVASILKRMGMKIFGINTSGEIPSDSFSDCLIFEEVKKVSRKTHIVINTLPLTERTEAILDDQFFANFRKILFINVGRGKSLSQDALIKSLQNNFVQHAVLDVFEEEPLPITSPLWEHEKMTISPHQGAITDVQDIVKSFLEVADHIRNNTTNQLFVNRGKGY